METMMSNEIEIRIHNSGQQIRQVREEAGISIRELAERLGRNRGWISKIENNLLAVDLKTIGLIAKGLEVPPERIIMKCLEARYPHLRETDVGLILLSLLSASEGPLND